MSFPAKKSHSQGTDDAYIAFDFVFADDDEAFDFDEADLEVFVEQTMGCSNDCHTYSRVLIFSPRDIPFAHW